MSDDGEYEWTYTYSPQTFRLLSTVLAGDPNLDVMEALERYAGRAGELESLLYTANIGHTFFAWP